MRHRFFILAFFLTVLSGTCNATILFDRKERCDPVPRYRTAQTLFKDTEDAPPNRIGLNKLPVSASGQPSETEILWIKSQIPSNFKLIFVDLRNEKHGYINGEPVLANTREKEEEMLIKLSGKHLKLSDRSGGAYGIDVESTATEKILTEKYAIGYFRFPTYHAKEPQEPIIDAFIEFVDRLDKDTWIHLHCREGWSRTTLYFTMLDMLYNANNVSLDAIIQRQHLIGGANMARDQELILQYEFLKKFYLFAKLRKKGGARSWSKYMQDAKAEPVQGNYLQALENTAENSRPEKHPEIANDIFQQNFYYQGQGCSSVAFLSEDGQTILKLFKIRDAKNEEEAKKRFMGYQLAMELNRENTGMLFWHLYKTDFLHTHIHAFDFVEQGEEKTIQCLQPISLDNVIFALQKKANNLGNKIKHSLKSGDLKAAKKALNGMIKLYEQELEKGLLDIDAHFLFNTGYIGEQPIRYDASHIRKFNELTNKNILIFKTDVLKHFTKWIQKKNLEGQGEIMETIVPWIASFPENAPNKKEIDGLSIRK